MGSDWTAGRMYAAAAICLVLAAAATPLRGDARLAAWTFALTFAAIFGISGWIVARQESGVPGKGVPSGPGAPVAALASWTFTADEWRRFQRARLDHEPAHGTARRAAWLIGVPTGALLWWSLGPEYGAPVVLLFAVLMPVARLAELWLFAPRPGEVRELVVTEDGFVLGDESHPWRDADGDSNVVSVAWIDGPPAMLDVVHVAERGDGWAPRRTLLPVPEGREPEGHRVLKHLRSLADSPADSVAAGD